MFLFPWLSKEQRMISARRPTLCLLNSVSGVPRRCRERQPAQSVQVEQGLQSPEPRWDIGKWGHGLERLHPEAGRRWRGGSWVWGQPGWWRWWWRPSSSWNSCLCLLFSQLPSPPLGPQSFCSLPLSCPLAGAFSVLWEQTGCRRCPRLERGGTPHTPYRWSREKKKPSGQKRTTRHSNNPTCWSVLCTWKEKREGENHTVFQMQAEIYFHSQKPWTWMFILSNLKSSYAHLAPLGLTQAQSLKCTSMICCVLMFYRCVWKDRRGDVCTLFAFLRPGIIWRWRVHLL